MPLTAPKLDDRHFQDLVDEAKKRIPHYCKEWTDHNVSDPGVTLIELFAYMTDIMLYRMNLVPDLHYIKFMEMFGIRLSEPEPATVPVTFWLSAPQPGPVIIPAGTEVASTQTETEPSIIFTTNSDLIIQPTRLAEIYSRIDAGKNDGTKAYRDLNRRRLELGSMEIAEAFSSQPRVGDALYFGFENDPSDSVLGFDLELDSAGGAGSNPNLPPYIWEASTGVADAHWASCDSEVDTTKAMNVNGRILIHTPKMGRHAVSDKNLFWVRARVKEITPEEKRLGMSPYTKSPILTKVSVATWGGRVLSTHARLVTREFLGQSDGTPGQRFKLQVTPVLKRQPGENLVVQVESAAGPGPALPAVWQEVPDFGDSGSQDPHYLLDSVSGELRLGPAVRQPDGTIKLFGAVPPRRSNLIMERYRAGGGQEGNVQAGIINTLKTAIPYVAKVANREPAWGGLDPEALESAMLRAPALLRARDRAVTESDYEFLASQALPQSIGRVRCIQPRPSDNAPVAAGLVYILVVPRIPDPARYLPPDLLVLPKEEKAALTAYLDERRLLTTRLEVREPAYIMVAVKVRLRAVPGADPAKVEAEILARLYRFINPLTGGPQGKGWPFGRDLFVSEVYQCLQGMNNIQFARSVELFAAGPDGAPRGDAQETLEVVAHAVIISGKHQVELI
jgi:predicted phage baseplate assembly protein